MYVNSFFQAESLMQSCRDDDLSLEPVDVGLSAI